MKYLAILFILIPLIAYGAEGGLTAPYTPGKGNVNDVLKGDAGTGPGKTFGDKSGTMSDYSKTRPGDGNRYNATGNPSGMSAGTGPGPGTLKNQADTGPGPLKPGTSNDYLNTQSDKPSAGPDFGKIGNPSGRPDGKESLAESEKKLLDLIDQIEAADLRRQHIYFPWRFPFKGREAIFYGSIFVGFFILGLILRSRKRFFSIGMNILASTYAAFVLMLIDELQGGFNYYILSNGRIFLLTHTLSYLLAFGTPCYIAYMVLSLRMKIWEGNITPLLYWLVKLAEKAKKEKII